MKKIIFVLYLLIISVNVFAAKPLSFRTQLKTLVGSSFNDVDFGLIISDSSNKILYKENANKNFSPASTLKLFTAFAGLTYLGSDFQYQTAILANPQKLAPTFNYEGDLYLKFSGDPSLSIKDLDDLLKIISAQGFKKINGSLIIDDTAQDQNGWSLGTILEDTKVCFAAPVTAIVINENCINANVQISDDKKIILDAAEMNYVKIDNLLQYSPTSSNAELFAHENNYYTLSGTLSKMTPLKIAVQNNRLFAKKIINSLLQANGILISKHIQFGSTPPEAQVIALHRSLPLASLITLMLKHSDNIIANAIFRSLMYRENKLPGTWQTGSLAVTQLMQSKLNISSHDFAIADGSGASIYNIVKPIHVLKLLNYLIKENPSFNEMLPHAGKDGTLKNRMLIPPIEVYAKTGTETGISSLAGYLTTKKNHSVSFVIMINHGLLDVKDYRLLEDKICYLIYNNF